MLCSRQIILYLSLYWRITCCSQVNKSLSPVDAKYLDLALFWRVTCCSQVNESLSPVDAKYLVLALFWRITCCSQVNVSLSPVEVNKEVENFFGSLSEVASNELNGDFEDGVSGVFGYFFDSLTEVAPNKFGWRFWSVRSVRSFCRRPGFWFVSGNWMGQLSRWAFFIN